MKAMRYQTEQLKVNVLDYELAQRWQSVKFVNNVENLGGIMRWDAYILTKRKQSGQMELCPLIL